MHRISIKDISVGDSLCSVFLISIATKSESKNGPFWRLELRDATGTLEAKIWSPLSQRVTDLQAGDFMEIKGKTSLFREQMQLTIEAIRPVENPELLDIADFLPTSAVEPAEILANIESLVQAELSYAPWKTFVKSVLTDQFIRNKLLLAPAAKSVHHAYAGGLLEHMHSVAGICLKFCDHYPELDRQTLFVAGLFHDIGKLKELSGGLLNDYTDEGRLIGHIVQGLMLLKPYLEKAKVDPALTLHFEHLILSHHGELEYGAPKIPMTPEAFALHYADNIDAKLAQCRETFSSIPQTVPTRTTTQQVQAEAEQKQGTQKKSVQGTESNIEDMAWSPWVRLLGRSLCRMPQTPKSIDKEKNRRVPKEKQGLLLG